VRPDVALVTALYPPSVGGIQAHVRLLGESLAQAGANVLVVTRAMAGTEPASLQPHLQVLRVGRADVNPALQTATFVAAAADALRRLRPHVVHAHQLLSPVSAALAARPFLRAPLVVNPHACGPLGDVGMLRAQGPLGRARLRATVGNAQAFVAISSPIEQELRAVGAEPSRIHRLVNGVDLLRFRPAADGERAQARVALGLSPTAPLVSYVGRLSHEKGVDVLLHAWPLLLQQVPGAELLLAGDGPARGALEAQVLALGLGRAVHLLGAVSAPEQVLLASDAAVLPSRTEGLPVALLEAMATGLPVVATSVGGTPEVMDAETGQLVLPEDPPALAQALARALRSREAQAAAVRARARIESLHGAAEVAARHLALYDALGRGNAWETSW
jgi:glycosyltransferase involved in cell wall biosynthesis